MKQFIQKKYAFFWMCVAAACLSLASCVKEESGAVPAAEEGKFTLNLSVNARNDGADPLVLNDDDHFSSLAVYVFDGEGNFRALYKQPLQQGGNTYTQAIEVLSSARKIFVIANYAAYSDLDAKLVKGLSLAEVKKLTAHINQYNQRIEGDGILMVAEKDLPVFASAPNESEHVSMTVGLKRLAARVDLYVFKEKGWTDEVTLEKAQLVNGVMNTTLDEENAALDAPSYMNPMGDRKRVDVSEYQDGWKPDNNPWVSMYSYRTDLPVTDEHAALLDVTLTKGSLSLVYKSVVADPSAERVTLESGNVYQVTAILAAQGGVRITTNVLDWYEKAIDTEWNGVAELAFAWEDETGANSASLNSPATLVITPSQQQQGEGVKWKASLGMGVGDFTLSDGANEGNSLEGTIGQQPIRIQVRPLNPYNAARPQQAELVFSVVNSLGRYDAVAFPEDLDGYQTEKSTKLLINQVN